MYMVATLLYVVNVNFESGCRSENAPIRRRPPCYHDSVAHTSSMAGWNQMKSTYEEEDETNILAARTESRGTPTLRDGRLTRLRNFR